MFCNKKLMTVLSLVIVVSTVLAGCGATGTPVVQTVQVTSQVTVPPVKETVPVVQTVVQTATAGAPTATPVPVVTRTGAWVDEIVFTEQNSAEAAVTQLQANDIDVYAYTVADPKLLETVKSDPNLAYTESVGSFNELTFNPVLKFKDGRLNPFGDPKIREAMNYLVDRNFIVSEIFGGLAIPMFTTLSPDFADYARYVDLVRPLEAKYAFSEEKAKAQITTAMQADGATLGSDGKWQFQGQPVTLIGIVRTEDKRKDIGDYYTAQLQKMGFTVDEQYKTRSEASPIWNASDPNDGLWSWYTGGWIATVISRDDATNFGYYYTPLYGASPLWQAYTNTPEFNDVANKLWVNDFKSLDERRQLFATALPLSMEASERIFLVLQKSFAPQKANISFAFDLAGGVAGSRLFPYTVQFTGTEGGVVRAAQPGELVDPWNPIAGSNWIYDAFPQYCTQGNGILPDPYTGLYWPQRIESAAVVAEEGLPVGKTLDWLTLSFQSTIEVPGDAWADWDAKAQKFVTVSEKYTQTLTAKSMNTVTYPKGMFDQVTWHDGSKLSLADFVMGMILAFDPAKPDSPIYDEAQAPNIDAFLSHFRAVKIVSTDPLVITTWDDQYFLDAEWMVRTWWPIYAYGEAPWHTLALGVMADSAGDLAFSTDKASAQSAKLGKTVEWMSYIAGPSLDILKADLDKVSASNGIVYTPTLSTYITADEAKTRYANLQTWYTVKGHFWVNSGPFYLQKAFTTEKTVDVRRYDKFPDLADKWLRFGQPQIPVVEVTGPTSVKVGDTAQFNVAVSFGGNPYPSSDILSVNFLLFDAAGNVAVTGSATAGASDGQYTVDLDATMTGKLTAGSSKLEVVVVSKLESIPVITDYEFVATQ